MNQELNMNHRFKYIAVGIITYVVAIYAWKFYNKNK
ncbi:MAG: hypothetical protein MRERV_4c081 [Mycoplasmataceae bacterium RV_VA103A]|nr:MAG: hypothetical protein MRERV_11c038 [Mycoplasmataceae bacterium RV_VA103A]KLL05175.1 MAG: hypothetical protein MRERV_4c081 [Mycoplasmataceae bacterium RV_VA103A]